MSEIKDLLAPLVAIYVNGPDNVRQVPEKFIAEVVGEIKKGRAACGVLHEVRRLVAMHTRAAGKTTTVGDVEAREYLIKIIDGILGAPFGTVIHILVGGQALCGLPGAPIEWPPGHKWVNRDELADVTCEGCKAAGQQEAGRVTDDAARDDDYPTEDELARIRTWPWEDVLGLMAYIKERWYMPDWGWHEERDEPGKSRWFKISTAGWSGNEDIIAALTENGLVWSFFWHSSRRGGHYEFEVKDQMLGTSCGTHAPT